MRWNISNLGTCLVAAAGYLTLGAGEGWTDESRAALDQGKALYDRQCAVCHGEKGDGTGPASQFLFPKPRDFTKGKFKVRSTPTGNPPADDDLLRTVTDGMPGSAMPAFSWFSVEDRKALVIYVKKLAGITQAPSSVIRPGTSPPSPAKLIAKGKQVYEDMGCGDCHGEKGKGDGPSAQKLKDDWGQPAFPNPFTRGVYKGGGEPSDIYLRFTTGLNGTPMPSYEDSTTEEERWALVHYVKSLAGLVVVKQPSTGRISAKKIAKAAPTSPDDATWKQATATVIPQMLLWQAPDALSREVSVKALHDGKEIAFRVEWKDAAKNGASGLDTVNFRDGVAIQFPAKETETPPAFWMGHGSGKEEAGVVNLWLWKADWQEALDKGARPHMPMQASFDKEREKTAMSDAAGGWEKAMAGGGAGVFRNQVLVKSPVENLAAGGFGTLTMKDAASQNISGKGRWKDGAWSVVFKRSLDGGDGEVAFAEGKRAYVAVATWDGSRGERDGRKAISTWYYVVLEGR